MALDPEHLEYPRRRYGMDHDRYAWSMLTDRPRIAWPGGKPLAVWINVSLQHFPLNPTGRPVKLPGSMTMPYPDLRHYTLRDYGNRVGIYRLLAALKHSGLQASFAVNACLVERYPALLDALLAHGGECLGHSWNMDTPHAGGLPEAQERDIIQRSLAALRRRSGQAVAGWLSPGKLQSPLTPDLLAEQGVRWMADWVNDELPYPFHTRAGNLWSLPLATEIEDRFVMLDNQHSEAEWSDQVLDAADFLANEGREQGGRLLSVSLHPWVTGQPHRIGTVERVLNALATRGDVWSAQPSDILAAATTGTRQR